VLTSVKIEGFRGVREGGVEGLAPISILVGPNNSGKSTVLEAIAVGGTGHDPKGIAGLLMRRGGPPADALGRTVSRGAKQASVVVDVGADAGTQSWTTTLSLSDHQHIQYVEAARGEGLEDVATALRVSATRGGRTAESQCYVDSKGKRSTTFNLGGLPLGDTMTVKFVDVEAVRAGNALEDAYTRIDEAGQLGKVVKALGRSMAGLTDLRILKVGQDFVLHTFFEAHPPVPAYLAGDGFKRFLALAAAAVGTPKGVVLLEEPETFQHPRYLQELATLLHLAARDGTQVILSTHSLELIDLLLLAPEAEGQTYPAVHRTSLHEGKLRATTLPREAAVNGRESLLEDLRA
jgi:predicted ATPase